jgi:hypothetical protein
LRLRASNFLRLQALTASSWIVADLHWQRRTQLCRHDIEPGETLNSFREFVAEAFELKSPAAGPLRSVS